MDVHIGKGLQPLSEQEILDMYKVNTDFREPSRLKHNNRPTTVRRADGEISQVLNHQTTLELKPKYNSLVPEWSVEIMSELLAKNGQQPKVFERAEKKEGNILGGLMWTDFHIDELSYDNGTIESRMQNVEERTKRVLDRLFKFDVSKIMVAQMGDLFSTDGRYSTSSGKVHLQNNMHEKDSFKKVLEWSIYLLEWVKAQGKPVEYVVVPGNHDEQKTFFYGTALQYYFGDSLPVTVEKNRAYIKWGNTMIALGHGDNEKPNNFLQFAYDEFLSKLEVPVEKLHGYLGNQHKQIVSQNGTMLIKNLLAPNPKSTFTKSKGYDMVQGMHGFGRDKEEGEIIEVRG